MPDIEISKSARLSPDESKFLDENKISFTELMHESIEKKQKEVQLHSKKQLVNKFITSGVYAIIGLALLTVLNFSSNLFTVAIIGGLGGLFCIIGFYNLYLNIKEVNLYNRK